MKLWQFDGAKQAEKKGFYLKMGYIAAGAVAAAALAVVTAVFLKKKRSHK